MTDIHGTALGIIMRHKEIGENAIKDELRKLGYSDRDISKELNSLLYESKSVIVIHRTEERMLKLSN